MGRPDNPYGDIHRDGLADAIRAFEASGWEPETYDPRCDPDVNKGRLA